MISTPSNFDELDCAMADNASVSDNSVQDEATFQKFLEEPATKQAISLILERLSSEDAEPSPSVVQLAPPPTNHEVVTTVLYAWLASGFGVLAIVYPLTLC